MYRHILVPLDGSLQAEQAIPVAARMARASNGTMILLRVIRATQESSSPRPLYQAMGLSEREEAHQYLVGIAASRHFTGLSVVVAIRQGPFMESLQATAQTYQADLLICCEKAEPQGTVHWSGSFAEQLSQHLALPLLLLPARAPLNGSLAEKRWPIICLVASAGTQPEPQLIAPAAALLAAFVDQQGGHLHCASLATLAELAAGAYPRQQATAVSPGTSATSQRSATLLQEAPSMSIAGSKQERADVLVLATPLPHECEDALQAMRAFPCLLIPSQTRGEEQSSQA